MPSSNSCAGPALAWRTPTVSFQAESFGILADGHCYTSATAKVDVNGDPGDSRYTTLELEWNENNREMRYFIYFGADRSGWWSDEMRTYDGQEPHGDWLYYYGAFFKSPIGGTFAGSIDLQNDKDDTIRGELHVHGLTLSTTLTGN